MSDLTPENDVPIDDALVVLDLLYRRWNDGSVREVIRRPWWPTHVTVTFHRDFSSTRAYEFLVTDRVVDELIALHQIIGKPHWGGRDNRTLVIAEAGELRLWEARRAVDMDSRVTAVWWLLRRRSAA